MASNPKTTVEITVYEVNGMADSYDKPAAAVLVTSHFNISRFVVLRFAGESVTVSADDLSLAVQRCSR